jgi:hypothetical protein
LSRPLKRHPALQPLSREHHHILLLGFKIRQGLKNDIEPERIVEYCIWFLKSYLEPHFEKEEFHLSHVLTSNSEFILELKHNHQQVKDEFQNLAASNSELKNLEKCLVAHVRFEERDIFEKIQSQLTEENISYLENHLEEAKFQEQYRDVFWV